MKIFAYILPCLPICTYLSLFLPRKEEGLHTPCLPEEERRKEGRRRKGATYLCIFTRAWPLLSYLPALISPLCEGRPVHLTATPLHAYSLPATSHILYLPSAHLFHWKENTSLRMAGRKEGALCGAATHHHRAPSSFPRVVVDLRASLRAPLRAHAPRARLARM